MDWCQASRLGKCGRQGNEDAGKRKEDAGVQLASCGAGGLLAVGRGETMSSDVVRPWTSLTPLLCVHCAPFACDPPWEWNLAGRKTAADGQAS